MKPQVDRLEALKAFGLYILGGLTYWEIAQRIPALVKRNPSTAAANARTRVFAGWNLVRGLPRWNRGGPPSATNGWAWLPKPGARLDKHPVPDPPPDPDPFEDLMEDLEAVEQKARNIGEHAGADGLRNLRAAMRFNRQGAAKRAAEGNTHATGDRLRRSQRGAGLPPGAKPGA